MIKQEICKMITSNTTRIKNGKWLIKILIYISKGRRLTERWDGESPRFTNNLNQKIYKLHITYKFGMFPSDPTGSLDGFFLRNYSSFGGSF